MTANLNLQARRLGVGNYATVPGRIGDEIVIRPLEEHDIGLVTRELNPDRTAETHRTRLRLQDVDRAAYLIAWHDDMPVAHGLVIWNGPIGSPKQHLPMQCPYIEDLWVRRDVRSQGIGGAMVRTMESLAAERGHDYVGLSVGIDNPSGLRLYSRLGYVRQPVPIYTLSGMSQNAEGEISFWSEDCQYMRKSIRMPSDSRRHG